MAGSAALTFDDGPDPIWTPLVLDALARAGARATFFVVAPLAARYPRLLHRAVEEGHEVGFHCDRHLRHDGMTRGEVLADAEEGLGTLRDLGHRVGDWRVPWGVVTGDTVEVAAEFGLRLVGWTADSEDWRGDGVEEMLGRVAPGVGPGAVVLMHDAVGPGATRGGCAGTVALIPPLLSLVRSRDLAPVPAGGIADGFPAGNPGEVSGV